MYVGAGGLYCLFWMFTYGVSPMNTHILIYICMYNCTPIIQKSLVSSERKYIFGDLDYSFLTRDLFCREYLAD